MDYQIRVEEDFNIPKLLNELVKYNESQTGIIDGKTLDVALRSADNEMMGGLHAISYLDCLEVRYLWLRSDVRGRGYGRQILLLAEQIAIARGCHQVYLDTFDFQAPEFYKKLGYEVFGKLEGLAGRYTRYFMRKKIQ